MKLLLSSGGRHSTGRTGHWRPRAAVSSQLWRR